MLNKYLYKSSPYFTVVFGLSALLISGCEPEGGTVGMTLDQMNAGELGSAGIQAGDMLIEGAGELAAGEASLGGRGGGTSSRELTLVPAFLQRLSSAEIRQTVEQLFGINPTSPLEAPTRLHGFERIANAELTLSPVMTEQVETLAWEVADYVSSVPERLSTLFPCPLTSTQPSEDARALERDQELLCVSISLLRLGESVWRRPLDQEELASLMGLYRQLTSSTPHLPSTRIMGRKALISALIQSPPFVFRVEIGEPDPLSQAGQDQIWRYTSDEMASRLSYFMWGSAPDAQLLEAAASGSLVEEGPLKFQAERLLADPRSASHLSGFFDELIGLPNLDAVSKDHQLFPEFSPELRASMREEIAALFREIVFEQDVDVSGILLSERASLDSELASIYGVIPPVGLAEGERFTVNLPASHARGGLLGRAAPLTLFSHATINSPTHRGRFVRSGLLCQDVPPPPEGVVTELAEPEGEGPMTLRQRLEQHATDPLCASCHQLMDPLGYPLEYFNPIGRWRVEDNGLPIDSSGDLDGVAIHDASTLAQAVAASPYFTDCLTRKLYRYAVSHLETEGEFPLIDDLTEEFTSTAGRRLKALIIQLVLSDGFRRLAAPQAQLNEDGDLVTPVGCGGVERCDGVDNDCDGESDEAVIRVCESQCGAEGIQFCTDGQWGACDVGPAPPEACDGRDNDCDGEVDEGVSTAPEVCDGMDNDCDGEVDEDIGTTRHEISYTLLSSFHPSCQSTSSNPSDCNAAVKRFCQDLGCNQIGFGPVEVSPTATQVVCLSPSASQTHGVPYQTLAQRHEVCDGQREYVGPNCNAAIHRQCALQLGQTTGFGPIERSDTEAFIACVPSAEVLQTTYSELSSLHGSCHQSGDRHGLNCNSAINRLCQQRGFISGWGPLENSGDFAVIACVR